MARESPRWKPVSAEAFRTERTSGQTTRLPVNELPSWAMQVSEVQAVWVSAFVEPRVMSSTGTVTPVTGSFDVERRGKKPADPLKYDRYYYICMQDGSVWQSGPYKNVDYGHHLAERPAFLNEFSRSTGTTDT